MTHTAAHVEGARMAECRDDRRGEPPRFSSGLNWQMAAVLVALAIQSGVAFIWFGRLDQRVTAVEAASSAVGAPLQDVRGAVARLDERTVGMEGSLARIEQRLDARDAGK